MAAPASAKEEAIRLLGSLPEDASWDDVHYAFYIAELRRRGIEESAAGKKVSHDEARRRFGLASMA